MKRAAAIGVAATAVFAGLSAPTIAERPALQSDIEQLEAACGGQYAKQRDTRACTELGRRLASGEGVPKDFARAEALFVKGCFSGKNEFVPDACYFLGAIYENGLADGKKKPREAQTPYRMACEADYAVSCVALGGVVAGRSARAKWFDKACALGPDPCVAAGEKAKLWPEQLKYFGIACEGGNALGCARLAILHRFGRGTPIDKGKAAELFGRSCALGNAKACEDRDELRREIAQEGA
ncbi:MAG: tetratricopeptide repeat protein [Erythrobacter sp.]|uniref:tetratricopeptide repeat protein n=1 Tax=Erythrobacter sp. TaxID=1042 RepID=UPI0032EF05EC